MPFLPPVNRQVVPPQQQAAVRSHYSFTHNREGINVITVCVCVEYVILQIHDEVLVVFLMSHVVSLQGQMNPGGNGQQPQGDMPAGPVPRFRVTLLSIYLNRHLGGCME